MTTINAPIPTLPTLGQVERLSLTRSNPSHRDTSPGGYAGSGAAIADLGEKIGAGSVLPGDTFADAMLRAMDGVSADQKFAESLMEAAVTEPGSVDTHDLTIAQAKASMSLNIARTVLSRVVQGWRDLINTR
jgi:flagellar hook-basal body complex protein FliE